MHEQLNIYRHFLAGHSARPAPTISCIGLLAIVTNQNSSWVPYAQKPRPVALTWICDKIGDPAKDATDAPDPASDAPVLLLTLHLLSQRRSCTQVKCKCHNRSISGQPKCKLLKYTTSPNWPIYLGIFVLPHMEALLFEPIVLCL